MKKIILFCILFPQNFLLLAQHCPWDCSGMILLQTDASKPAIFKLHPVLVDENQKEINDTVYGTGEDIYDPCIFLSYEEFRAYRIKRIKVHHGYQHDTVYYFADGFFMVKYNYCEYRERRLYLRFDDPNGGVPAFHYIEIPDSLRIHLHDYSSELYEGNKEAISNKIQPFIVKLDCESFLLRKEECK